jgi:surfeit locus 1 family protein
MKMNKRMIAPLLFGIGGIAILLWLGFWQLNRLQWKQDIISSIEDRRSGAAAPLLGNYKTARPATHNYLRVEFDGDLTASEAHVYAPQKSGLGYRVVSEFMWNGKAIFVDLGWISEAQKNIPRYTGEMRVTGYISFPDDHDESFTPEPDIENNIWFSRLVAPMAQHFNVTPFLVVAEKTDVPQDGEWVSYDGVAPAPISINIKNDHKEYAITWFSLAVVWFGMTGYLLWRIRRKTL